MKIAKESAQKKKLATSTSKKATENEAGKYIPSRIEPKWQEKWEKDNLYRFRQNSSKEKYYNVVELPYPSGDLHLGHWFAFVPPDVHARYKRMAGFNVFFPNGFDAFGLPAENAAIKRDIHPQEWTMSNIETMTKQFGTMGTMIDWTHKVITCLPEYYRWNQWIFLKMFERNIAYRSKTLSNWCPLDQTVLANEHVENGKCWRCGTEVVQKEVEQWFLKITEYADRLIWPENPGNIVDAKKDGLVDWPKSVKEGQNNWIGKSEGMEIDFKLDESSETITIFTVYPETIYGVTYMVVAPEHEIVEKILSGKFKITEDQKNEVKKYFVEAKKKSELDRKMEEKEKTGVFTGLMVVNPVNGKKVPLWVADYVIGGYGTGAVMGVPGSDERDFAFAQKYQLPVIQVIVHRRDYVLSYLMGATNITDSDLKSVEAKIVGKKDDVRMLHVPNSKLSEYEKLIEDKLTPGFWNEYIGNEIVFLFKDKQGQMTRLVLGEDTEQEINRLAGEYNNEDPTNESPWLWLNKNEFYRGNIVVEEGVLVKSGEFDGLQTPDPAREKIKDFVAKNGWGRRKTQYHLHDWSISRQRYWGTPVPIIHCPSCGLVPVPEKDLPVELPYDVDYTPKGKAPLASNEEWMKVTCPTCGGEAKRDPETLDTFFDSSWYFFRYLDPHFENGPFDTQLAAKLTPLDIYFGGSEHTLGHTLYARFFTKFFHDLGLIDFEEFALKRVQHGIVLGPDGNRMSKSKGNVVNPDDVAAEYGADTVRLYLSFMMPYEAVAPWDPGAISGIYRFLRRVWELREKTDSSASLSAKDLEMMHKTIKKVGEDIGGIKFNTAVSTIMEWLNHVSRKKTISRQEYETFILLLAPFAPHITEELWHLLGNKESVHLQSWPEFDSSKAAGSEVIIVVQVNGKVRDQLIIESAKAESKEIVEGEARKSQKVQKYLEGSQIRNVIYVPGKVLNFVV